MRGVGTGFTRQARHQQGVEQGGVAVGEQVFEFGHGRERLVRQRVIRADADVDVVMRRHVPFEGRENDLAGIAAGCLRGLDEGHFIQGHAGGKRNGAAGQRRAGMVAVRQPQMVREGGPVQLVAVKGLIQRAFQADLRVVRLVGVHVQVTRAPGSGFDRRGGRLRDDRGRGLGDGVIIVIATACAQQGDASQRQGHDGPAQAGYFELHGHTPTSRGPRRQAAKRRTMPVAGDAAVTARRLRERSGGRHARLRHALATPWACGPRPALAG
ncbi:hypothetical protein D3C72_1029090 [compost metagenome]